ncbi:WhiB family transcriptional regulator [Streptomyces sp. PKU-MA01144]|nr:WhiB family transcriptional regulator [Streptomyces sp. PKU-MA01144]
MTTRPAAAGATTPDWHEHALCRQRDPNLFHPTTGESSNPAKQVCTACPVRMACLEHAIAHGESGVWGGTTAGQRRAIRRAREARRAGS